jgi:hypothetical protein
VGSGAGEGGGVRQREGKGYERPHNHFGAFWQMSGEGGGTHALAAQCFRHDFKHTHTRTQSKRDARAHKGRRCADIQRAHPASIH